MRKFYIWTIGCQMNKAESEQIGEYFQKYGYEAAARLSEADLVILNTCVVRQAAEDKVHGTLGYLKGIKNNNADLRILVTGCFVNSKVIDLQSQFPQVDLFFKPGEYSELHDWLQKHRGMHNKLDIFKTPIEKKGPVTYIPIIQGCNNFCSYCIVPYRRGREKSRQLDDIVSEVRQLVKQGTKEVILLGQNVNSYGHDLGTHASLHDLLYSLNCIDGLSRIRFLTNHPKDINSELIQSIVTLDKVCEHITLPFQSGDNEILEYMKRDYTVEHYVDIIYAIRNAIPDMSLSTDVIVGFPGETDEQFARTLDLLREIRFDAVHIASYSPRPQTIAARQYVDNIHPDIKKERHLMVESLNQKIASEINSGLLGKVVEILVEGKKGSKWYGRTRGNKLVFFEDSNNYVGQLLNIEITKSSPWALQGCINYDDLNSGKNHLKHLVAL